MSDREWYVEKKQKVESRINSNHKGLMPKCFNCNASYKMVPTDKPQFNYKAEHPRSSCPFGTTSYGEADIDVIAELRKYNEKMIEARNRNAKT